MTWSVYQHWDPLRVCVVGRSYPPEFYSWITVPHVRSLFEKIALETEEDYQNIIKKLQSFGVEVLRPEIPNDLLNENEFFRPPMTPRDYTVMIGDTFYVNYDLYDFNEFYCKYKDHSWPQCNSIEEMLALPGINQSQCIAAHDMYCKQKQMGVCYSKIIDRIRAQGNIVRSYFNPSCNGAMVTRIGKDLYFGTTTRDQDTVSLKQQIDNEFKQTRNHIINTAGHCDGTYCPVCPGLIISLKDIPTYKNTFPDWEVVYLPNQSWSRVRPFLHLKEKNKGKWWIPGFEYDQDVVNTVETWLGHWTGYVEETVFDVNMLIVDPKNVIVFNYNKRVFDAFERYGITPHIVPFRHRYFWDGGIHCITSDLHREGTMQDYFPNRSNV